MKSVLSSTVLFVTLRSALYAYAQETARVVCGGGTKNKKCLFEPKDAPKTERYGVRCCGDTEWAMSEMRDNNGCSNWAGSIGTKDGPGLEVGGAPGYWCPWKLTYEEAELFCESYGAQICSEELLEAKCAKAVGCHLNWELCWTYTPKITDAPSVPPTGAPTAAPVPVPVTPAPTNYPTMPPVILNGAVACGVIQESGGQTEQTYQIDLEGSEGTLYLWHFMYINPDQFEFFYDGTLRYTTNGLVSGEKVTPIYINGVDTYGYVTMKAPNAGTAWQFAVCCDQSQIPSAPAGTIKPYYYNWYLNIPTPSSAVNSKAASAQLMVDDLGGLEYAVRSLSNNWFLSAAYSTVGASSGRTDTETWLITDHCNGGWCAVSFKNKANNLILCINNSGGVYLNSAINNDSYMVVSFS